jgi:hypothetical protein
MVAAAQKTPSFRILPLCFHSQNLGLLGVLANIVTVNALLLERNSLLLECSSSSIGDSDGLEENLHRKKYVSEMSEPRLAAVLSI